MLVLLFCYYDKQIYHFRSTFFNLVLSICMMQNVSGSYCPYKWRRYENQAAGHKLQIHWIYLLYMINNKHLGNLQVSSASDILKLRLPHSSDCAYS